MEPARENPEAPLPELPDEVLQNIVRLANDSDGDFEDVRSLPFVCKKIRDTLKRCSLPIGVLAAFSAEAVQDFLEEWYEISFIMKPRF